MKSLNRCFVAASAAVESLPFFGAYDNLAVVTVPILLSHVLPS